MSRSTLLIEACNQYKLVLLFIENCIVTGGDKMKLVFDMALKAILCKKGYFCQLLIYIKIKEFFGDERLIYDNGPFA